MMPDKNRFLGAFLCALLPAGLVFSQTEGEKDRPEHRTKPPREAELTPWMGVATSPVHPYLRQHLQLDEGFAVQINHVTEGSPAEAAGIMAGDVMTKVEDQLLISPEHLAILVRSRKKGDEVPVTILRKGAEQVVTVTLEEREMPPLARNRPPQMPHPPFEASPGDWENWHRKLRDYHDQFRKRGVHPPQGGMRERPRLDREGHREGPPAMKQPGPRPPKPAGPGNVIKSNSVVKIDNEHGEVTLTMRDGEHRIEIRDEENGLVYGGPFDQAKGIAGLPEKAREHLKKMKVDSIGPLLPPAPKQPKPKPKPAPEKGNGGETL